MTTPQALNFFLIGLGMIAGPAVWPEYFSIEHMRSTVWLVFMGGLQVTGGLSLLLLEAIRLSRRLSEWEPLDIGLALPDVQWTMPPSLYSGLEDTDEVVVALRLRQQLLRRVAA
jgi:hypothetical protein